MRFVRFGQLCVPLRKILDRPLNLVLSSYFSLSALLAVVRNFQHFFCGCWSVVMMFFTQISVWAPCGRWRSQKPTSYQCCALLFHTWKSLLTRNTWCSVWQVCVAHSVLNGTFDHRTCGVITVFAWKRIRLNGIWTQDLRVTGAMLYQLRYEAINVDSFTVRLVEYRSNNTKVLGAISVEAWFFFRANMCVATATTISFIWTFINSPFNVRIISYIYYRSFFQVNPLSPSITLQILHLCFHTFLTEVVRRSCKNIKRT